MESYISEFILRSCKIYYLLIKYYEFSVLNLATLFVAAYYLLQRNNFLTYNKYKTLFIIIRLKIAIFFCSLLSFTF